MTASTGNAPAWLFAFVDLAFLLLLGMTQLGGTPGAPDLADLVVPQVGGDATAGLPAGADRLWQLRVQPAAAGGEAFELVPPQTVGETEWLDADGLEERLAMLRSQGRARPLLAPHADSRSEDLLEAIARIEHVWPGRRRATVARLQLRSRSAE